MTIGHDTHLVPDPFLVMATQNPIESEGTYPLPEAQVDRFMLKIVVGYPSRDEELTVVQRSLVAPPDVRQVLELEPLQALQRAALDVYVDPSLVAYAVSLAEATRNPASVGLRRDRRLHRVRRQPAWPDRARPERPRARLSSTAATTCSAPTSARSPRTRCVTASCSRYRALAEQRTADDVLDARARRRRRAAARAREAGRRVSRH